MTTILTVLIVLFVVFIFIWAVSDSSNEKEIERLRQIYISALSDSDKKTALMAGRSYYTAARKNKSLTIFDEMAIANDLSTMPQEVYIRSAGSSDILESETAKSSASTIIA